MNGVFLQSREWQNLQRDLGETTFFESEPTFSYLAILKSTSVGKYLYLPYGPVAVTEAGFKSALKSLKNLAKTTGAFFIRIEPQNPKFTSVLSAENAQKTKDLNPKDTWVLDLTPDDATLISNFSQGTRTRFNQFKKKGLSVEVSKNPDDIQYLVSLQQKLAKQKNLGTFSPEYLKTELSQPFASLYLVKYTPENESEKVIAASLFFDDKVSKTRFYMQSAADSDYKKLPATVALLTTSLFDAKKAGLKRFDFWGIAPDNADKSHPWAGFTEFKKSFGGEAVHYAGTFDLVLDSKKYQLYTLLRKINRKLRKL